MVRPAADKLLTYADLAATLMFSIEGAAVAAVARADLFGIFVIAFATALGGGMLHDVLIGDTPVAALRSVRPPVFAFAGATLVIIAREVINQLPTGLITVLDALGLGLFCVTGTAKALDHRMTALAAVLLGTVTGCGGGVIRDVLLNVVPVILLAHIYAVAAMTGAIVMVVAARLGAPRWFSMSGGVVVCVGLRLLAVAYDWNLPRLVR